MQDTQGEGRPASPTFTCLFPIVHPFLTFALTLEFVFVDVGGSNQAFRFNVGHLPQGILGFKKLCGASRALF